MRTYRLSAVFGLILACLLCWGPLSALAVTPAFTIAATDVTVSSANSSGFGSSSIALTSVDGYTGTVQVICDPPTPSNGVKTPYCNGPTADPSYTLTANKTVTAKVGFSNATLPAGIVGLPRRRSSGPVPVLALAGVLLWGIAKRRRAARFLTLILVVAGSLATLGGMSACGGSSNAVTPGTYVYTLTASDHASNTVTTSIHVTVP